MAVPDEDSLSFTMRAVRWGSVTGSFFIWFPMGITFFGVLTAKRYRTPWKSADKKHSALKTCLELSTMTMMYHCGWRPSLGTEGNVFRFTVFYLTDTIIDTLETRCRSLRNTSRMQVTKQLFRSVPSLSNSRVTVCQIPQPSTWLHAEPSIAYTNRSKDKISKQTRQPLKLCNV